MQTESSFLFIIIIFLLLTSHFTHITQHQIRPSVLQPFRKIHTLVPSGGLRYTKILHPLNEKQSTQFH